jgi:UDP-N-acetyl-D-glucosamine dehydrogenase
MDHAENLIKRFEDKSARISILGLGYVGLPLAVVFAEAGFHVIGYAQPRGKLHHGYPFCAD